MSSRLFLKIIIIGDSTVGKTSLLSRYVNDTYTESYKPTIGVSVFSKECVYQDQPLELQLWDTSGQERFQSLGGSFFRGADVCILSFDLTNHTSFENLELWKSDYLLQVDFNYREELPFVIVGLKADKQQNRSVTQSEIREWCRKNGIPCENYFELSAKENTCIEETMKTVLAIGCRRSLHQLIYHPGVINIKPSSTCRCCSF